MLNSSDISRSGRSIFLHTLAVFIVLFNLAGCSPDIVEKDLSDLREAREKGVLKEGGWLPELLPASSREIRLRYDVDTNEVWIGFDRSAAELAPMDRECAPVDPGSIVFPRKVPWLWWPDELTGDPATPKAGKRFDFYRCRDGGVVAVASGGGRSFYWFRPIESG